MLLGLERIKQTPQLIKDWGRVGLVANQASVTSTFEFSWRLFHDLLGPRLTALFGPQHGFEATVQDNMIETSHGSINNIPVYSLYSETREPTAAMLDNVDTIVVDLQITGCRIYTFKATIAGCLRAAVKHKKRVVILDRPNPLGGVVLEGRVLEKNAISFVGEFKTPMRHGLSPAEAAQFFNAEIGASLTVVPMSDYDPKLLWKDLRRPWVITSPNLPTIDPVYVYPGTVIFEGTNISEGRGTGLPFQFIGAPYIKDSARFIESVRSYARKARGSMDGIHLREASFEPTSQKWAGKTCRGLQIHVLEPEKIRSFPLALAMVRAALDTGSEFAWKDPPYEYDYKTLPMKLILGSLTSVDKLTAENFSLDDSYWYEGLNPYVSEVQPYLLYPREMRPTFAT